jgi:hypothetical protein
MDRFTQIPEYITADCCSGGEAKTVLSRSSRWAIATLEKPFWEALLSLNPSGALSSDSRAQSIVLSHLDSRWPETVGFKNPSLFPASKDSHAFINRYRQVTRKRFADDVTPNEGRRSFLASKSPSIPSIKVDLETSMGTY